MSPDGILNHHENICRRVLGRKTGSALKMCRALGAPLCCTCIDLPDALSLAAWREAEDSKAETQVDVRSPEGSAELLAHGVNRKDIGREAISELGFGVALWNGSGESWSAGTSVTCGLYSKNSNLSNVANLTVECKDEIWRLIRSAMINLLKQLITVWDSDNGRLEQTYMPSNANMSGSRATGHSLRVLCDFRRRVSGVRGSGGAFRTGPPLDLFEIEVGGVGYLVLVIQAPSIRA